MGIGLGKLKKWVGKGADYLKGGDIWGAALPGDVKDVMKNMVTFGGYAQQEATKEAKRARDQAKAQYDQQIAAAEAESSRIANLEEERKRRLALYGTQAPSTLMGGYLGVTGAARTSRSSLG